MFSSLKSLFDGKGSSENLTNASKSSLDEKTSQVVRSNFDKLAENGNIAISKFAYATSLPGNVVNVLFFQHQDITFEGVATLISIICTIPSTTSNSAGLVPNSSRERCNSLEAKGVSTPSLLSALCGIDTKPTADYINPCTDELINKVPDILRPISNALEAVFLKSTSPSPYRDVMVDGASSMDGNTKFFLSAALYGRDQRVWSLLYSAKDDGFSMNRFEFGCFKYSAPTFTLVYGTVTKASSCITNKVGKRIVVGAYLDTAWSKSKHTFGGEKSLLFFISPIPCICRMILSPKGQQQPAWVSSGGVGFGSRYQDVKAARLYIDFNTGVIRSGSILDTPVFENFDIPRVSSSEEWEVNFEVDQVEVFGLGAPSAKAVQERERRFEAKDAERRQNVNVRDTGMDKTILELAGVHSFSTD
ncbi:hypothetical protein SmJEL517_g02735 [Synchytrium microbalum]|uniref:TLDc domain-containing protein n=1 Tax=Synchytrium microbalum TaxID=1806994 RepID=A0A507C9R2_9FUNG|nr:uncharacterized protein SmJEL517_g02735 [Synchytrium microbalum]TPX34726.1 hypothetical protein SmJEL517_g02735 [Synchytrium microbalum]